MTIWLKRARKMCGYTSRQLADMTGYKLNTIQRIEGGSRRFEGEARALICRALSLSPETAPLDCQCTFGEIVGAFFLIFFIGMILWRKESEGVMPPIPRTSRRLLSDFVMLEKKLRR